MEYLSEADGTKVGEGVLVVLIGGLLLRAVFLLPKSVKKVMGSGRLVMEGLRRVRGWYGRTDGRGLKKEKGPYGTAGGSRAEGPELFLRGLRRLQGLQA